MIKLSYIITKEIKESFRDIRTLLIMLFMPILLTSILSVTFKDKLSSQVNFSDITLNYILNCNESERAIMTSFFSLLSNLKINTKETLTIDDNIVTLKVDSLDNINIFYNEGMKSDAKIIYSLLDIYLQRYSTISLAQTANNFSIEECNLIQEKNYISEHSLDNLKSPSSLDYYGIVMITLSLMFASVTGAYKIIGERNNGTLNKLFSMPLSKGCILIGKLIGVSTFVLFEAALILIINNKFLGVYVGDNMVSIFIVLFGEGILAVSLGLLIGSGVKNNKSAWLILLIIIIFLGFLGGAFIPLSTLNNNLIYKISVLSPLTHINKTIFNIIYLKTYSQCFSSFIINGFISVILMFFSYFQLEANK